jgi:uncharacterized damage-inducible protein DinB
MKIQEILATGTRAQELLYSVVKEHSELVSVEIKTSSKFKSIGTQLAHCIGAEMRWQNRLLRQDPGTSYEDTAQIEINRLYGDWTAVRVKTTEMLSSGGIDLLMDIIDVNFAALNIVVPMTGEQILYNIIAHESYHRGQCSYLLQMFNVDPPNFDFPLML